MAAKRLSMRKIREVLRLVHELGLTQRKAALSCYIGRAMVQDYVNRAAAAAGLGWPLPEDFDDAALEKLLFPPPPPLGLERPLPDWGDVHTELKHKGVTLSLLWQE